MVRFLLSVMAVIIKARDSGPTASIINSSSWAAFLSLTLLMARSIFSLGILASRAFSMAFLSSIFISGSAPRRAAMEMTFDNFEKSWPFFWSATPFLCFIWLHFECPDMLLSYQPGLIFARFMQNALVGSQ